MQALVAVTLRHGNPVFHPLRIRLIHIGDDREYLPAFRTFFVERRIENDTDGKQVVDPFEIDVLFPQFVVDRVDRLRASFDIEFQPRRFEFLLYGSDKFGCSDRKSVV